MNGEQTHPWWQTGIVYQIYPRSYMDSNGDGIGDLPGITSRLDYIKSIGVDAVWLSPIYPSPMADFGYDVADYTGINPMFGTMNDFSRLVEETHTRGLKLMLDFVPNHTSNLHPWFIESSASRYNPKRDWYIWLDPAPGGGAPNNWLSVFGGPAWEWNEATGQYYMHSFLREQPELNWRNPEVREAMYGAMRFWLDKGVDGFRVDVINFMIKDDQFRDEPHNPSYIEGQTEFDSLEHIYSLAQPGVHEVIRGMRAVLDSYNDRMMVGETYLPIPQLVEYYGNGDECHLPFNFALIDLPWEVPAISRYIKEYEAALPDGAWPNWVLGNHDRHRIATRVGAEQARVANMLLLTLRGTPTCYYGDELGMTDGDIPLEMVQDPWEKQEPGIGLGRDPERTPMQWTGGLNAGFSAGTSWLPVAANYTTLNVEAEETDPTSPLALFRRLVRLRRSTPALVLGDLRLLTTEHEDVMVYEREYEGQRVVVALNFSAQSRRVALEGASGFRVLLSTYMDAGGNEAPSPLGLRPNEGIVLQVG